MIDVLIISLAALISGTDDPPPDVSWEDTAVTNRDSGLDPAAPLTSTVSDSGDVTLVPSCALGGQVTCFQTEPCLGEGTTGIRYDVYLDGEPTGTTYCQQEPDEAAPPQVTPALVLRAFRSYAWPASELVVQPPNGRTAVNFETFFHTTDDEPVAHVFTLLGRRVEVEATPASYTWVWGDGEQATTTGPGAPYPSGDVTHEYRRKGAVQVRLDTTYAGRYRVDGGPWVGLPGTLTVAGTPQALEVVEVQPTLVS